MIEQEIFEFTGKHCTMKLLPQVVDSVCALLEKYFLKSLIQLLSPQISKPPNPSLQCVVPCEGRR